MSIWEVYEPVLEGVEIAEDVRKNEHDLSSWSGFVISHYVFHLTDQVDDISIPVPHIPGFPPLLQHPTQRTRQDMLRGK